jgi:hypothetical protein
MALQRKSLKSRTTSHANRIKFLSVSMAALGITLLGAIGSLVNLRFDAERREAANLAANSADNSAAQAAEIAVLQRQIDELQRASKVLQGTISEQTGGHNGGSGRGLNPSEQEALSSIQVDQKSLDQRLTALEGALLQSPEKAIALPLLRQQLADIQEKNRGDEDNINGEINRLYGMMQWFLGLMITLIIGVGGLVVNSFRQNSERRHKQHLAAAESRGHSAEPPIP